MTEREGILLGVGNPLLDIIVQADVSLLQKYNLEPNNAIIAEDKHLPLYTEIEEHFEPVYIAGGSAQNVLRVFQWLYGSKNASVYMGSVGKDHHSEILKSKATENGVKVCYQYQDNVPTGTCAVLVTYDNGSHRSLCANLGAANCFTKDHILKPENLKIILETEFIYIGGFFLTVSPETIMELADISFKSDKILISNLNAQFICQFFTDALMNLMPYIDVLCGNETEAAALAETLNFNVKDLHEIALKIAQLPKKKEERPRIVVITQGHLPVILVQGTKIVEVEVPVISKENIVDTNGAGDAFVGGFLSQFIRQKSLEDAVKCGIWAASQIIQNSGCSFDSSVTYKP